MHNNPVHPPHPYHPPTAHITGPYTPPTLTLPSLLLLFTLLLLSLFLLTTFLSLRIRPSLSLLSTDHLCILWFVLCGFLHCFFEGYYVLYFRGLGGKGGLFAELWKEYGKGDSRYLVDVGREKGEGGGFMVLALEGVTVLCWGPLSFLTAYLTARDHHLRYPFQALVSLAHVYGDVVYYLTAILDEAYLGISHSRPEALYYWGYFWGMNAFWIVIPLILIWQSVRETGSAFKAKKVLEDGKRKTL